MDGVKERQGDFVFSAKDSGEYRFCFNNEMSTFAEKMVDFEIAVGAHTSSCKRPIPKQIMSQTSLIYISSEHLIIAG